MYLQISKQCKEVISKAKKLINVKEVKNVVNNVANQVIDETSHMNSPIAGDINGFLSWMVEKVR